VRRGVSVINIRGVLTKKKRGNAKTASKISKKEEKRVGLVEKGLEAAIFVYRLQGAKAKG